MGEPPGFIDFSGPDGGPTEAERRLIEASAEGARADGTGLADSERRVSAALIAALARGTFRHVQWPEWAPGSAGVQLTGGHVHGLVDLARAHLRGDLVLDTCVLESGITLEGAQVDGRVCLGGCLITGACNLAGATLRGEFDACRATLSNPQGWSLKADRLTSEAWFLNESVFRGHVILADARIAGEVYATAATFEASSGQAVHAPGMQCAGWVLDRATVRGAFNIDGANISGRVHAPQAAFLNPGGFAVLAAAVTSRDWNLDQVTVEGMLNLQGAHLHGGFFAPGGAFDNGAETALMADNLHSGDWTLNNATVTGTVSLIGARIGHFSAWNATFTRPGAAAVWAEDARAASWFMNGAEVHGRLHLAGAVIEGQFGASDATFDHPGDMAVWAQRVTADQWNLLRASIRGRCDLSGAEIATSFGCIEATFSHPGGDALVAAGARIGAWWMSHATIDGGVNVNGAAFERSFHGEGVTIRHASGAAIDGQAATFPHGVLLCNEADIAGDVDLTGATIGQQLDLSKSHFRAGRHRAIRLQDAHITGEVSLRESRLYGHLHGNRARIEGRVDLKSTRIVAASLARSRGMLPEALGPAVNPVDEERQDRYLHHAIAMQEARIDGRLVMPDHCPEGIVDVSRARCDTLEDDRRGWPAPLREGASACDERLCITPAGRAPAEIQHLVLDGFEYGYLEFPAGCADHAADIARARSDWLAGQSAEELSGHFNPQPWLQAAAVLRAMGHDEEAQDLAIARRVRQRLARSTPRFRRIVSWLLHRVSDYGFNPWKTVRISIACVLMFAIGYWALVHACGGYGVWTSRAGACGETPPMVAVQYGDLNPAFVDRAYPVFEPIMYSLDTFVPFLDLGSESYWRANTRAYAGPWPVGWALYLLMVIERFIGAVLLAIAITGFTGLLTRDER